MKVKYLDPFYVSGITTTTNNANESDENSAKIPTLWQSYVDDNIEGKTFNKAKSMAMYGVYTNYESNEQGEYDYTIGIEVTKPKNAITIPKQRYLVFTKQGELPEVVIETWQEIWDYFASPTCEHERVFTYDFEKYAKEDEIEIYIAIG